MLGNRIKLLFVFLQNAIFYTAEVHIIISSIKRRLKLDQKCICAERGLQRFTRVQKFDEQI